MSLSSVAESHVGEPGPDNTCLSNGVQKWAKEAGLPTLGNNTPWVSQYRQAAIDAGFYHAGMDGVQVDDVLDWALPLAHVSVVAAVDPNGKGVLSVGSGTRNGNPPVVSYQPATGGYYPLSEYRGYIRLPGAGSGGSGLNIQSTAATTNTGFDPLGINGIVSQWRIAATILQDRNTWIRLGIGTLGAVLLLIAAIRIFNQSSAGQAVTDAVKTGAKTAGEAALLAP